LPWLINKVAIAQQSSASGFLALRQSTPTGRQKQPFVGFGDPLFLADAAADTRGVRRMRSLAVRSVADETLRALETALNSEASLDKTALRNRPTLGEAFSFLPPLPDTGDELREIAEITGGSPSDIYLGARATESNVKSADLTGYRVLAFATHGLVPGELSGLDQPALALANPALTQESNSDGLLTLEEVLGLKLNAEWVILSACNTASADGQASEAVSGLGRAFFYAGTRSLLVSNWAVETVSARLLTTGLFKQQASNPGMDRAEALRQSMQTVMNNKPTDYSHPAFWAPFSLVGDGSGR
jgi:CHAT domain-containing protein